MAYFKVLRAPERNLVLILKNSFLYLLYTKWSSATLSVLNELVQRTNGLNGGVGLGWLGS